MLAKERAAGRMRIAGAEQRLISKLSGFEKSDEAALANRLASAVPSAVTLRDFSLIRRLGKGASGVVYAARKEDTTACFALKAVWPHKRSLKRKSPERTAVHLLAERRVAELAAESKCINLCGLRYAFVAGERLFMALPLCSGGTLQTQLDERAIPKRGLHDDELRWICAQLTLALTTLHGMSILHRDVKPSNVLVRSDGYLILSDYGLSARYRGNTKMAKHDGDEMSTADLEVLKRRVGTRGYWAPEVVRHDLQGPPADWWSLGVLLAFCGSGEHPMHQQWERSDHVVAGEPAQSSVPKAPWDTKAAAAAMTTSTTLAVTPTAPSPSSERTLPSLPKHENNDADDMSMTSRRSSDAEPPYPGGPARYSSRHATRLAEEGLNFNTLYMPSSLLLRGLSTHAAELMSGLLERDMNKRLCGKEALHGHPFLQGVEWELMAEAILPAPFVPDPQLVYAKDFLRVDEDDRGMPPLEAEQGAAPAPRADVRELLEGWQYVCGKEAYAEELAESARKLGRRKLIATSVEL